SLIALRAAAGPGAGAPAGEGSGSKAGRAAAGPGAGVPAGEGSGPELGPPENGNVVRGRIAFAAYLGNTLRYDVEASGGHVLRAAVRDPWHHEPLQVGRDVAVSFPASATLAVSDDDARE